MPKHIPYFAYIDLKSVPFEQFRRTHLIGRSLVLNPSPYLDIQYRKILRKFNETKK